MSFGPFFSGEVYPFTLTIEDKDDGSAIDLTGMTAKVFLRQRGASANRHSTDDDDAVLDADPTTGIITYLLPSAWTTDEVAAWTLQIQLIEGGVVRKTEKINFSVEAGLS